MAEQIRIWLRECSDDICNEFKKQYVFSKGRVNQKIINKMVEVLVR